MERRHDGPRRNDGPRRSFGEKHKAVCSGCGKDCEVPFKPTEGRDVFCKECYQSNRPRRD